ncbi:MAG TPA: MBOAT family protein [Longimicrobiales bacterium]|nr:MBOAT family protein [Longimicrobiales bacterium]
MWFNSWEFFYFLPCVLIVYYALGHGAQNIWLIAASYFFYGWWDWRFLTLILASTVVDYWVAGRMPEASPAKRKRLLLASLTLNLGALATFKYFNFFVDSFVALGASIGLNFDTPALRLLPPVGISFYTFQTLSYTIDVYRGRLQPCRRFADFALFVCYFPQLVAGPIERAQRLLPQIAARRVVTAVMLQTGACLILVGLFKKLAIADTAGLRVNDIFANPGARMPWDLWKGMVLFSLQIYGDFSGYSNIARGVSRLFGIELIENFETPYFSKNITEFWRRWHVSLSQWLRDYLYIPLGGNRHGTVATYRNLMLTMLIGGLWHGAAWTFVAWGGLHGLYLAIHKYWLNHRGLELDDKPFTMADAGSALLRMFITFNLVSITWVFFRADSFATAWIYLTRLFSFPGVPGLGDVAVPLALLLALLPIEWAQYRHGDLLAILDWPPPLRGAAYAGMIVCIVLLSGNDVPFIYFQF